MSSEDKLNKLEKLEKLDELAFAQYELLPAIVQDYASGEVLMLAYMNRDSLQKTLETGLTCFWSRSRKTLWLKGETSGNTQVVKEIFYDCDADTLLIKVQPNGPACHTGHRSCFFRSLPFNAPKV
jgi:phosphoribosyl-AMP cyclohydrolase